MTRDPVTLIDLAVTLSAVIIFGAIYAYLVWVRWDKERPEWLERYLCGSVVAIIIVLIGVVLAFAFPKGYVWMVGLTTLVVIVADVFFTVRRVKA